MTLEQLCNACTEPTPPREAPPLLLALWHDARGDWDAAHAIAQGIDDRDGAWLHAYLHRREGDPANAGYWYRRAGRAAATGPLEDEWLALARAFTEDAGC